MEPSHYQNCGEGWKGGINTAPSLSFCFPISCLATYQLNSTGTQEGGGCGKRGCLVMQPIEISFLGHRECICMRRWDDRQKTLVQKTYILLIQKLSQNNIYIFKISKVSQHLLRPFLLYLTPQHLSCFNIFYNVLLFCSNNSLIRK